MTSVLAAGVIIGFLLRCAIDVAADLLDRYRNGENAQRARLLDPGRDCRPGCTVVRRPIPDRGPLWPPPTE